MTTARLTSPHSTHTRFALHPRSLAAQWACLAIGAACCTSLAPQAWAQTTTQGHATLEPVLVSGSRAEQRLADLPQTAYVVDANKMRDRQMLDIRDLTDEVPNASVRRAPERFAITGPANATGRDGNAGFTIRGMNGNRVLLLVDGVREPQSYVFGGNAFGRDAVPLDLIKRVEIVPGPTSALYGSDGLGGLVQFFTLEPSDLLRPAGQLAERNVAGRVSLRANSANNGWQVGGTVASKANDALSWLAHVGHGQSHGMNTKGAVDSANIDRTTANPQDNRDQSFLLKGVLTPSGTQRHVLTIDHVRKSADVHLLSSVAKPPLAASSVLDERGSNRMERTRASWQGSWQPSAWLDSVQGHASAQRMAAEQTGFSDLNTSPDRYRIVTYRETTYQAGLQARRGWDVTPSVRHLLTVGVDGQHSTTTNLWDGITPIAPEVFPLKRFPDTRTTVTALYAQSEWSAGPLQITPGVRWDRYAVNVITQDGFYPPAKVPARSLSGQAVSPKLGLMFKTSPQWTFYGQLAAGFRAPSPNQVNGYYDLLVGAQKVIIDPNPDLRPEKSRGLELGTRAKLGPLAVSAAVFNTHFTDLIVENIMTVNTATERHFQTQNIDRANIHGGEINGHWNLGELNGVRYLMPFSWGVTRGTNRVTGLPINTIDPQKGTLGLTAGTSRWGARAQLTFRSPKTADQIDQASAVKAPNTQFTTPGVTTLDLHTHWSVTRNVRLQAALLNTTNQKYWLWSDVLGLAASTPVADAYTQPGRSVRVGVVVDF